MPELNGSIAPCFEAASHFIVAELRRGEVISRDRIKCSGKEGYRRIRLLEIHDINLLVCNGIEMFHLDLIHSMGVKIIYGVTLPVDDVLAKLVAGELAPPCTPKCDTGSHDVPLNTLICWATRSFEDHGYSVRPGPGQDSFLIDLVAEMTCPLCNKIIRVAICCGAHTYRTEQEIREFHYCTGADYNARVLVCPGAPGVEDCCREYGIEFIEYESGEVAAEKMVAGPIPLLKGPISGHERVSGAGDA